MSVDTCRTSCLSIAAEIRNWTPERWMHCVSSAMGSRAQASERCDGGKRLPIPLTDEVWAFGGRATGCDVQRHKNRLRSRTLLIRRQVSDALLFRTAWMGRMVALARWCGCATRPNTVRGLRGSSAAQWLMRRPVPSPYSMPRRVTRCTTTSQRVSYEQTNTYRLRDPFHRRATN